MLNKNDKNRKLLGFGVAPLQNILPQSPDFDQAKPIKVCVDRTGDKRQRHSHKDNTEIKLNG